MQTRRFGRTGHLSTLAIFGGAAFWEISQADADQVLEQVSAAGVNHFDVAPSYGQAEERIGPWMPRMRKNIFLGCKTMERTRAIREGKAEQDPFDILYPVPPAIVKMFMEQSFAKPEGPNVVVVPRKEIPNAAERAAFYRKYAEMAAN